MAREGMTPEMLQTLSLHSPEREKVIALAQVWEAYRRLLALQGWQEEEDVYRAAAQALRESVPTTHIPRRVLFDGFARFCASEMEFLRALAEAGHDVVVTLCWEAGRDALLESTSATLRALQEQFEVRHEEVSLSPDEETSPAILHIAAHLLSLPPVVPPAQVSPSVEIWEAPYLLAEIEWIAREIARLHHHGMAWGEIAVLCRDLPAVLPTIETVFARFAIPTQSFEPRMIGEHPLSRTLTGFLRLHDNDYPRESVLQWLKSGYLPIDILDADRLRLRAVRQGIRSGAANWLRLAKDASDEGNPAAHLLRTTIEWTQALSQTTTPRQWLDTFQKALDAVSLDTGTEAEASDVLAQAMEVAHQVVALLDREESGTPSEWTRAVEQAWSVTPQRRNPSLRNAVWLLEAARSRPLRPRVAFVMGMQEGRFPKRFMEDALLRDDDRRWLNEHAGCHLPLSTDTATLERLVFYQAATCASHRVIFTYSRTEGDHDVQPSFYLRSLREIFPTEAILQRSLRLSDVTAPLSHTVNEQDIERTLVDSLFDVNPHTRRVMDATERLHTAQMLHRWLTERPERCQQWWRWRYLPDFPRLTVLAPQPTRRAYSASELEDMQQCPFRHFLRWEMKLRGERTHYAVGQGRWLHAVLHRHRRNPEQPLDALIQEAAQQHPVDRPTGERHLLLQQLEEMVRSVIEREEQIYTRFGLKTLYTEAVFGPAPDEEEDAPQDTAPPLQLTLPDGERMRICGRIDRVDICPQTSAAVLVDYKRNLSDRWWQKIQTGDDLQTVLYVAALRQVWKLNPAAVALDGALEGKRYRVLFTDTASTDLLQRLGKQPQEDYGVVQRVHGARWKSIERTAAKRMNELLHRLKAGDIAPVPGDHCSLCEYGGICRTVKGTETPVHDGEPYPTDR
jgi:ATP-dependent helicase/nuclease subunit B